MCRLLVLSTAFVLCAAALWLARGRHVFPAMAWWQKPRSFRAAGRRPPSQSRPNTGLTAEVEEFLQEILLQEDDAGKEKRVNAEEQLQRNALQAALGPLHKTGRKLTDHTATGGLYLKYKACRTMDDIASKFRLMSLIS
eukprot:s983_g19.t1